MVIRASAPLRNLPDGRLREFGLNGHSTAGTNRSAMRRLAVNRHRSPLNGCLMNIYQPMLGLC
jgi:hypothetical protein